MRAKPEVAKGPLDVGRAQPQATCHLRRGHPLVVLANESSLVLVELHLLVPRCRLLDEPANDWHNALMGVLDHVMTRVVEPVDDGAGELPDPFEEKLLRETEISHAP